MNAGKIFEQSFKNSVPDDIFYYRLRDGTASWGEQENTRFQQTNICDCILYKKPNMFMLELKSHKGKSIPFGNIKSNQLEGLCSAQEYGIKAGFIFNMRDVEETYYVSAIDVWNYMSATDRKSIPINYMREQGIQINQELKRVRYRYDIDKFVRSII